MQHHTGWLLFCLVWYLPTDWCCGDLNDVTLAVEHTFYAEVHAKAWSNDKAESWSILRSWNLYFEAESWLWFWFWWFYIISIGWWNLRIPQRQRPLLRLICINQPSTNSKKEKALYRRFHICHPHVLRTPPKNTYLIILYWSPNFVVQITATS